MRIIARLNVGGPAVHCDVLANSLKKHGFETTLVAGTTEPGEASYEDLFLKSSNAYRFVKLPKMRRRLNFLGDLKSLFHLIYLMRKERPQIVHTHTAKAGFLGRVAAIFTGVPVVIHTYHGHVLSGYFSKPFSVFITFLEKMLAFRTTALVTLSPQLKSILAETFRVAPTSKFHVVSLGRDLKPFLETPRRLGKIRSELGLNEKNVVLGIMGRLVPIKAHGLLFDALEKLQTSFDWRLLVIGEGPLLSDLKERILCSKKLKNKVFFLGWRKDLADIYSDLDLSVLSSLNEGTPLSIIESFASGCPVLSTDVGGVRDMLTGEGEIQGLTLRNEGVLVPSQNVDLLSRALKQMIEDPNFRQRCSVAGRRRAMAYTDEALANRVAEFYKQLLIHRA